MRYQEKCECCGHIKTAFTHRLSKQLVMALRQLVDHYDKTKLPCNLQKDLDLNKNQYNNFQKLQYFYLVKRTDIGWFPTAQGMLFIKGKERSIDLVATIESKVLEYNHKAWDRSIVKPRLVAVWEIHKDSWKQRVEYQEEKSSQESIWS